MAILYGGIWSWYSACWMELRMPKSPQPGHQSTWTSVLYCCNANFFGAGAAGASGMRHHDLLLLLGQGGPDAFDDLIARKRPAIVLQHVVVEDDARLLGNDGAELRRVVVLDQNRQPRVPKNRGHGIRREWAHQANLQEVHRAAVGLELAHGVEDGALGRTPGHQRQVGLARTVQGELGRRRTLTGGRLELRHPFAHYGAGIFDAFGDVTLGVMFVAGGREDPARHPGQGPGADGVCGDGVAAVAVTVSVRRVMDQSAGALELAHVDG